MKRSTLILNLLVFTFYLSCSSTTEDNTPEEPIAMDPVPSTIYFPPQDTDTWEGISLETLGWNLNAEQPLLDFLEAQNTKAFLVLKDGRMVMEHYFNGSTKNENNPWYSVGKSVTAVTAGIAKAEGFLSLTKPSSEYLGTGWSQLSENEENAINVGHHLSMSTGLDYTVPNLNCTDTECLNFLNDPNTVWYYHNAAYTLTQDIIAGATMTDFESYFNAKIKNPIGMDGQWVRLGFAHIYFSTARSMARFGLLNLTRGQWENTTILDDISYFDTMTTSSQDMNKAYGYLWWLNGKESFRVPGSELEFQGKLIPNAPDDLIAGLGKDDQKLYLIPSQGIVIVRMGDAPGDSVLGPSSFDVSLWENINALIN